MNSSKTRWLRWIVFPVLSAILGSTLNSFFPGRVGFICLSITLFVTVGWWLTIAFKLVVHLFQKRFSDAGRHALAFILVSLLTVIGIQLGDYIHLALLYPHYRTVINEHPHEASRFSWGDDAILVTDGLYMRILIYDDGDKTRSAVGFERDDQGIRVTTMHLIGNFFIEEQTEP